MSRRQRVALAEGVKIEDVLDLGFSPHGQHFISIRRDDTYEVISNGPHDSSSETAEDDYAARQCLAGMLAIVYGWKS